MLVDDDDDNTCAIWLYGQLISIPLAYEACILYFCKCKYQYYTQKAIGRSYQIIDLLVWLALEVKSWRGLLQIA